MVLNGIRAVTLAGNNSYTGKTFVNAGTLIVNGTHYSGDAYTVAAGATLAGTGTIGTSGTNIISLNSGANIAPGNNVTTGSVGTLSLPNLTISGGGTAYFDLSNSTSGSNDLIVAGGSLAFNGSTTVVVNPINSVLANGDYPLFDYNTLSFTSSANNLLLAPGAISPGNGPFRLRLDDARRGLAGHRRRRDAEPHLGRRHAAGGRPTPGTRIPRPTRPGAAATTSPPATM